MPRLTTLVLGFITAILCGSLLAANTLPTVRSFNKMPLAFTQNNGQWDSQVLFRANAGGATMWFTKEGVTYQFTRRIDHDANTLAGHPREGHDPALTGGDPGSVGRTFLSDPGQAGMPILPGDRHDKDSIEQLVLTAKFVGANPNPEIIAEGQMEYKCNYFLGNDPSKWHTDVPNYEAITLKDVYPGIDLKYSGDGTGQAAYEFIAAPGADIAHIKVEYEGAESTSLDSDGKLILKTKWGDMTAAMKSPVCAPRPVGEGSGVRAVLSGTASFSQLSAQTLSSAVSAQSLAPANSGTLSLFYSTYLGGEGYDWGSGIAVDGSGNAYVTGGTLSSNFPTLNPYQTDQGSYDVFVTKLASSGNSLIFSTYFGGEDSDLGYAIAIDSGSNSYVTGWTNSSNFPTLNPYQATFQGGYNDVFVAKLSSSGDSLIYSTYLGGESYDLGSAIAVDGSGYAYVTGGTESTNFPTLNPYQSTYQGGPNDAFVTKLSSLGNSLIYSTYLGGEYYDYGYGIAVDGSGNAYVTGPTTSSDFPTLNPYQTYQGPASYDDVFVTKFSSSGNSLIYSTYLGGGDSDWGNDIAVDGSGNAYVTGMTYSSDFPTLNPYQTTFQGFSDVFVTKLSNSGNSLIYSTYVGGGFDEAGHRIAVDGNGNAYVTGYTYSSNLPTLNPYQTDQGGIDAFVTKLSNSGNSLIYSTYLGGGSDDFGNAIAVDGSGNAYVTGQTISSDFPTLNPYQPANQGWSNAFMIKLSWTPDYPCGDANTDEQVDLRDAVILINYIFVGGPAPEPLSQGDVDCSRRINIADVVRLIIYIFCGGPAPCTECG